MNGGGEHSFAGARRSVKEDVVTSGYGYDGSALGG